MFNINLLVILFLGFVDYLGIGLVYPIFGAMLFDPENPIIAAEASSAYRGAILGILMGLTPLSAFLFAPFLGSYSDIRGRKNTLLFGMVVGIVGYALACIAITTHSLSLFFIFRILVGITEGSAAVAQAAIADISDESVKARNFSLFSSSAGFGFAVGPFLGGKLAGPEMNFGLGLACPFLIAGWLCAVNLLFIWGFFPRGSQKTGEISFKMGESIKKLMQAFAFKQLIWLFACGFCLSFGWALFNEFMPVLLRQKFSFSLDEVGNYFAWGGIWYFLSSGILTAPLVKRFPPEYLILPALIGCAFCMTCFSLIDNSSYISLTLPFLMYFLSAAFPILMSLVSSRTPTNRQGEVLGVHYSVQGCAMGLSPILAGSLLGAYPGLTGIAGACIMFLGVFAIVRDRKEDIVQQTNG